MTTLNQSVKKVFIDTSVFIRFLTKDDHQKFEQCSQFFELVEEGKIRPYTSNIVILEIQFVLIKVYNFSKAKVLTDIETLLNLRNLILLEKTNTRQALSIYKKHNIKYADCMIATQIPIATKLLTYDEEFSKIDNLTQATPKDFL